MEFYRIVLPKGKGARGTKLPVHEHNWLKTAPRDGYPTVLIMLGLA